MASSKARTARFQLPLLGVAAVIGASIAAAAAVTPATDVASVGSGRDQDVADQDHSAEPVVVDEQLIKAIAHQVLVEESQPQNLTNMDLIARDILAGAPATVADADRMTRETMLGFGPGAPADVDPVPPPQCSPTAKACIDVDGKRAWLMDNGVVTYGPVPTTTGMPGYETARGTHRVLRHVRDDHSIPYDSPMPYSTYFTVSGMAFHEGRLDEPSHGCIHLGHHAAAHFFNTLRVGDEVTAY